MALSAPALLLQLAAAQQLPVLALPESGLDDPAAYQGYQTRFFRDAAGNTVQVYADNRAGRLVTLLADAENESVAFSARRSDGQPAALAWGGPGATAGRAGRARTLAYALVADAPAVTLGQFLLGTMRVERDFQYFQGERRPFAASPVAEVDSLLAAVDRLEPAERTRHLGLLNAPSVAVLRARAVPTVTPLPAGGGLRLVQPTLDGRDTLALEVRVDPRRVAVALAGDSLTLRARGPATGAGARVPFTVRVSTTGRALTPLRRAELFTPAFLEFVAAAGRAAPGSARARLLERQVRGVELLASREKLMAGLPTYATYFGRDMMVSALMMRPVARPEVSEFVVASVLRNLAPDGQVSHEEALGGQAVREGAAEYAALRAERARALGALGAGDRRAADSLLARARTVLRDLRVTRQNYHMVDDELQLPVLAARYLRDPAVPAARKRAFLADSAGGEPRAVRLVRELALVARMTAPYAREAVATNLVSFPARDSAGYASASWRDSGAGYGGGRFAFDVNALWAPHALEALGQIVAALRTLGYPAEALASRVPEAAAATPFGTYARDPEALRRAVTTWRGAERHFTVRLGPAEVGAAVRARLAAMPDTERTYWTRLVDSTRAAADSLTFDAVALDAAGRPIPVANSDAATRLFLGDSEGLVPADPAAGAAQALRDVRLFARDYPAGLLVGGVGPVVANDAYAAPAVWRAFERDPYHGPRVVWGREVNLFLLGTAARATGPAMAAHAGELRAAARRVRAAVEAAGFRSELWSYGFAGGRPVPRRYGAGADVQLWSTTDLAVQYALARWGL